MKFLANENFPYASINYLKNRGFDITSIGMENPSIKDAEVMEIAVREERTILTFDRDYGELIFRHNHKPEMGVIFLRLENYSPIEPGEIIEQLALTNLDPRRSLTVIHQSGIRQRRY
jgi:predicted nuclease of predicted toxin-antitoxin system